MSLADLIVVKSQEPGTTRLRLSGPAGDGILLLDRGRVVHAAYGELPAEDAAYLLVTEENVDFEVEHEVELKGQTLDMGVQELLLESMRRLDEGILKRPRQVSIEVGTTPYRREAPRPRSHIAKRSPETEALRRATGRVLFAETEPSTPRKSSPLLPRLALAILGIVVLGVVAGAAWRSGLIVPLGPRDPVDLLDLAGPNDVLPLLLSGPPAVAPDSGLAVLPSILCDIVIDARGRVVGASVASPREGLEAFERAAVGTVRGYRFSAASREGVPVRVKMRWPVDFVPGSENEGAAPVDTAYFTTVRDRRPEKIEGEAPASPIPERRLRPRIECRLLIDEEGRVVDAEVVRPREDLELYQRVALDALRDYRFTPGEREGVRVPVYMLYTVEFQ